jgi:hypothetical protein
MNARDTRYLAWLCTLTLVACGDPPRDPTDIAPSLHRDGGGRETVVVDANGRGTAKTIQEGIAMAPAGGRVLVLPGTYSEALVIDKGLTLEGIGGDDDGDDHGRRSDRESRATIIAPPGTPTSAIQVATSAPVTIRGLTVHSTGTNGIRGDGVVDVTVERVKVLAANPPLGGSILVAVINNAPTTGRARVAVRGAFLDGTVPPANSPTPAFPQVFGIRVQGDVDALLEGNVIRRTGGACIHLLMRSDFGGETNANIINNDLDECNPLGRVGSLFVGAQTIPTGPVTATGVVNIVGNTIRNTFASCLATTAIGQSFAAGRIERNRILSVVLLCATPTATRNPSAIWIGSLTPGVPPVSPVVRFNDIEGNAHAGLRVAPNITTPIDASCNYWGSASGPSGAGPGTGDAIVVETGGATPAFAPFASGPVAQRGRHGDADERGGSRCALEVLATGLDNPRGVALAPDGALYVVEAGKGGTGPCGPGPEGERCYGTSGAVTRIDSRSGASRRVATGLPSLAGADGASATGAHDISFDGRGGAFLTLGFGGDPRSRETAFGPQGADFAAEAQLVGGHWRVRQDLGDFEAEQNPTGDQIDTNPYGMLALPGRQIIADAGANDLIEIKHGTVRTLAVFPDRFVDAPPFLGLPPGTKIPMDAVPTSVVLGPDGHYYVGQLTGFPFPVGGANVYRVPASGGTPEVYASGFTNIIDIAFGADGSLYVLEIAKNGLLGAFGPPNDWTGALIRVGRDGSRSEIPSGRLFAPGGVAVGRDGSLYVTNNSILSGRGEVIRIRQQDGGHLAARAATR